MSNTKENIFLDASRTGLRFPTTKGTLATEDLWSLALTSLNDIAIKVDSELEPSGKSFIANISSRVSKANTENRLRLEILKEVIRIKQDENKAKSEAVTKKAQLEFLNDLKEKKQIANLESMTEEEIDAQIAALKG